jgi:hypothetical protein
MNMKISAVVLALAVSLMPTAVECHEQAQVSIDAAGQADTNTVRCITLSDGAPVVIVPANRKISMFGNGRRRAGVSLSQACAGCTQPACTSNWWKRLAIEPMPTNDLPYATDAVNRQEDYVALLGGIDYCVEDAVPATNLWNMLAVLHGDIRSKKMDGIPVVYGNFGIITNQVELQQRRASSQVAAEMRGYQIALYALEERIQTAFSKASKSQALSSFPASERNTIVSNLVATARLTPIEASALGMTNILVEATSPRDVD